MKKLNETVNDILPDVQVGFRIALFILGVTFGTFVLLANIQKAMAADLRTETVITGDYIRLGDIFDGVKNADYVLGPAPQPGKEMILNARTLYKIASALDVDWKPENTSAQIILKRDAVVIPQVDIKSLLEEKIRDAGVDEGFTITTNSILDNIVLPAGEEETMEILSFNFDAQNDTFKSVVVSPSAENPLKRVSVSGRIERLLSVPVLKNSLKNGDIIGANDLDFIEVPKNKLSNGAILNETDIVNMTPRRTISSGKPIMMNDLEHPKMVDRGDAITLVFESGAMTLTAKGKSLQSGAKGDTVRVSNSDSNKNLQGIVTAHREVTIR